MNQRWKLLECVSVSIAVAFGGIAVAADQERDLGGKGTKKSTQPNSRTAQSAETGKSNTAGPGAPDDIPLKDRKIVAPDDFASKDRKIVVVPGKDDSAVASAETPSKPIVAAPASAPSTPR